MDVGDEATSFASEPGGLFCVEKFTDSYLKLVHNCQPGPISSNFVLMFVHCHCDVIIGRYCSLIDDLSTASVLHMYFNF